MCITRMSGDCGGQKRSLDPLELELEAVMTNVIFGRRDLFGDYDLRSMSRISSGKSMQRLLHMAVPQQDERPRMEPENIKL